VSLAFVAAPQPAYRLMPSRFPPIGLFDTVATAADAQAVMELAGWTNDRLAADRLNRLPQAHWAYGRPNSSVIMAAFLHSAPDGMRFNGPELGAWYASKEMETAAAEVGHHLRREAMARKVPGMSRTYRVYSAMLAGEDYCDIRGLQGDRPDLYRPDSYAAAQLFGEQLRSDGRSGIVFDSVRRRGGTNMTAFIPPYVTNVIQTDHFEISVEAEGRPIHVRRLRT
jgi:RES domain.